MGRHSATVAVVSGGVRGMGAAHVRRLVGEGARVLVGDVLDDEGSALAAELGEAAVFAHLDVTRQGEWEDAVAAAETAFGPVTGLVNNAGIVRFQRLMETTEADYRQVIDVNQVGVFLGMQAVVPSMRRAGHGSIVNISSTAGMQGYRSMAYVASKWAVRGMTKSAAMTLGPEGIRVNSVHPGSIETPMNASRPAADAETSRIPLQRFGTVDEVAALVSYLLSDESAYTTGMEHVIDGGVTAGTFLG